MISKNKKNYIYPNEYTLNLSLTLIVREKMEEMNNFRWICTLSQHDSLQKQYILVISGDSVNFHLE